MNPPRYSRLGNIDNSRLGNMQFHSAVNAYFGQYCTSQIHEINNLITQYSAVVPQSKGKVLNPNYLKRMEGIFKWTDHFLQYLKTDFIADGDQELVDCLRIFSAKIVSLPNDEKLFVLNKEINAQTNTGFQVEWVNSVPLLYDALNGLKKTNFGMVYVKNFITTIETIISNCEIIQQVLTKSFNQARQRYVNTLNEMYMKLSKDTRIPLLNQLSRIEDDTLAKKSITAFKRLSHKQRIIQFLKVQKTNPYIGSILLNEMRNEQYTASDDDHELMNIFTPKISEARHPPKTPEQIKALSKASRRLRQTRKLTK